MLDVEAMLRICTRNLCGWPRDHDEFLATNAALDNWTDSEILPAQLAQEET